MQRTENFTGIWGANEQDRSLQEGMEPAHALGWGTVDRTKEHLVAADIAIVTARRKLLKMARDLASGTEPVAASDGEGYAVRAISQLSAIIDFDEFERTFENLMAVPEATENVAKK